MYLETIADQLRDLVVAFLPEGEVKKKFRPEPLVKPKRRRPSFKNKSDRSDYFQQYMQEYREEGKDYQKVPEKVKEYRREKKKEHEEKMKQPLIK